MRDRIDLQVRESNAWVSGVRKERMCWNSSLGRWERRGMVVFGEFGGTWR